MAHLGGDVVGRRAPVHRRAGLHRLHRIHLHGQLVDLDLHRIGGSTRLLARGRHHRDHRFANVAHHLVREAALGRRGKR